jgi:AcrR family transcriptional regulator
LILSTASGKKIEIVISLRTEVLEKVKENKMKKPRGAGRLSVEETAKLGDRLLDAAQVLFNEQGFSNTTMEQVARQAGSSTQTIYSRFENKTALLEAVVRRVVERTVAAHTAATAPDPALIEPRDYLVSLGSNIVRTLSVEASGLTRLSYSESYRSKELQRLTALGYDRGVGIIRDALTVWRKQGKISRNGDLDRMAYVCLSMMTDRPRIRGVLGDAMSEEARLAYVREAVEIFLQGCSGTVG